MNLTLVTIINEENVKFIDNDKNFLFRDGSTDQTLLSSDGLHLSALGIGRLLTNLDLQEKAEAHFEIACTTSKTVMPAQSAWSKPLAAIPSPPPMPQLPPKRPVNAQSDSAANKANSPLRFRGAKSCFSNFFPTPITIWNTTFKSTEHAYQFRKAIEMGQHAVADDIRRAPSGWKAMDIAESIVTNEHWGNIKQSIMYQLLQMKAEQCPAFYQDLEASKGQILVEDTSHEYWGRGNNGTGLNMLGRLLMVLRDKLPDTPVVPRSQSSYPSFPHYPNNHRRPLPSTRSQQPRCFNCGERSHNLNTCRHRSPIQCYSCQEYGHKQKFCRNNVATR